MPQSTVRDRIESKIKRSSDTVFLRREFDQLGDYRQVSRALRDLIDQGRLIRVGYGTYIKARSSVLGGKPVPTHALLVIGLEVMKKLGVQADVGLAMRELNEGKSTQVPMRAVIDVGASRVRRKISVGKRQVVYEHSKGGRR